MKVYKYRSGIGTYDDNGNSIFERDVKTLCENKIYAPSIDELNDPFENYVYDDLVVGYSKCRNTEVYNDLSEIKEWMSNLGIYSLSKTFDSELLWAYYASGHYGFVIEYDYEFLYSSFQYFDEVQTCYGIEVKYSNNVPSVYSLGRLKSLFNPDHMRFLPYYLGRKSKSWEHEHEIRLVLDGRGLIEYDFRAVTGIYFGIRMEKAQMQYINI